MLLNYDFFGQLLYRDLQTISCTKFIDCFLVVAVYTNDIKIFLCEIMPYLSSDYRNSIFECAFFFPPIVLLFWNGASLIPLPFGVYFFPTSIGRNAISTKLIAQEIRPCVYIFKGGKKTYYNRSTSARNTCLRD